MYWTDFQTWKGNVDVKSSPVYFYVQRSADFNTTGTPVSFDTKRLNVGGAMDWTSGKFTAPRDGICAFLFTGLANFPASTTRVNINVIYMYVNGHWIGSGAADDEVGDLWILRFLFFPIDSKLEKGDEI